MASLTTAGIAMAEGAPHVPVETGSCRAGSSAMARVELYFGGRWNDNIAWRRFVASIVTPRFPDGLTSFDAFGQWRSPHGLTREPAHVLIIFYKPNATSDTRIEAIRNLYRSRFGQNSVLRADSTACVGF